MKPMVLQFAMKMVMLLHKTCPKRLNIMKSQLNSEMKKQKNKLKKFKHKHTEDTTKF